MRILFISQYFYPEPFSNGDLAKSMVANGHDVDVVCAVPNYPEGVFYQGYSNTRCRAEHWSGMNIIRAWTIPRGKRAVTLMLNFLAYPTAALFTWWRRCRGHYDVTFTSMPSPIFQALVAMAIRRLRGTPAVYWIQDMWPDSLVVTLGIRNRLLRSALWHVCAWIYRAGDVVLVQSEAFRPTLEAMGVAHDRIAFLPNSAPAAFAPVPLTEVDQSVKDLMPAAALRLIFAGNVGESQNIDVYIDADRLLRDIDVQWVIVGHGRDLERIRAAVEAAGREDRFIFTGRQPIERMPHYYAMADAMLISLKDTPIFRLTVPFKLQSYLALGRPVIGSIGGEAQRIIGASGAGICVEPENPAALADAVRRFARLSAAERAKMGRSATDYFASNYSPERVYDLLDRALVSAAALALPRQRPPRA